MTKDEAYEKQRRERIALERENKKLKVQIEAFEKGTYQSKEKADHLKQISKLTWENKQLRNKAATYEERWRRQLTLTENMRADAFYRACERDKALEEASYYRSLSDDLKKDLEEAYALIAQLREEKENCENQQKKAEAASSNDGTNSGIPTSQTSYDKKKRIPNSRKKSGLPRGAQPGHEKHTMSDLPDIGITDSEEHTLDSCPDCASDDLTLIEKRTKDVIDYEVIIKKKRHTYYIYQCGNCGHVIHSPIPLHLKEKTQYGPNIQALGLALTNTGFVSINRSKKLIDGIIGNGISISEGYLCKLQKRYSLLLSSFVNEVRNACIRSKILHWDDTVIFINTSRACMRFYGNDTLALFRAHAKKNREGIDEDGILAALDKDTVVVHDHVTMNYNDDFHFTNAECCQHLERDLQKLIDISGHSWAAKMKELIQKTIHERNQLVSSGIMEFSSEKISAFFNEVRTLMTLAAKEHEEAKGRYYEDDERRLINRLEKYHDANFLWVTDFIVPPTNNLAERSLRSQKTRQKVSGQFQSVDNARYFADIRTYIETCYRNNINTYTALVRLTSGNPFTLKEVLGEA